MFRLSRMTNGERMLGCMLLAAGGLILAHIAFHGDLALAQSVSVGGTDNSGQMKDVQNLITTIQAIAFKWVAKIIGGFLVIAGIYKIASRDFMNGILATGGGGTLFFVEKIAESLSRMSGNG